jgi:hypothetical protein
VPRRSRNVLVAQIETGLHKRAGKALTNFKATLDHRADVDAYVAQRRDEARALKERVETQLPPAGIRERLLARRGPAGN